MIGKSKKKRGQDNKGEIKGDKRREKKSER